MKEKWTLAIILMLAFSLITVGAAIGEEKAKGRYLVLWEMDQSKIPVDPKVRGAAWAPLVQMVKQDMQTGLTISWGAFVGTTKGYTLAEGTVQEIHNALHRYVPFVIFTVYPIVTIDQVGVTIKGLTME